MPMSRVYRTIFWSVALMAAASAAGAQDPNHKTTLQDQPFPALYHTTTVRIVLDAGGDAPPHTHPGVEMGYIIAGRATISIQGQSPLTVGPGDSFAIPAGTAHSVHNLGPGALTIVSTYVVKSGEPITSSATGFAQ
jgi:quercetin dioxygenase-like cupin family protein